MRNRFILGTTIFFVANFPLVSHGQTGGKLYLQSPAPHERNAYSREKVRLECMIEERVPQFIKERIKDQFGEIIETPTLDSATKEKTLSITVTGVYAAGGGGWSGPKSVTLKGVLTDNGKVVGSFEGNRTASGGPFSAGTCRMLENCVAALSKDIARWLRNPTMDAKLGELR